ncbi:MAG: tRNA threonylcarbamoyladenosine dehydratase [Prevotella sp.]|nr:tRNA threonylcarbamoyladenosine dehydratase [Prevotella sp.]
MSTHSIFKRTELLLGSEMMETITLKRVIIFGVGGVGSWCAESLIRSGIQRLTIVDSDCVCTTNINRQLMATTQTIGQAKVEVLRERLLTINPQAEITALQKVFTEETAESFHIEDYDYIIDAIDSLKDKALLIKMACDTKAKFFSSMGAALKMDPTRIHVTEFWKVQGDPLARALRKKFKSQKQFPKRKFMCVYSDELLQNKSHYIADDTEHHASTKTQDERDAPTLLNSAKQVNGTLAHITAIFGFMLAGLVLQDVCKQ